MKHFCSWQHQFTSEKMWVLKNLFVEFAFLVVRLARGQRNCSCLWLLTMCCVDWTCRTHRKVTFANIHKTRWMVIQGSCFTGETARHSAGHRGTWLISCQYTWNNFSNFLLHWKVYQILCACWLKMDAPTLQRNSGWLSRQSDVSVKERYMLDRSSKHFRGLQNMIFKMFY